MIINHHVDLPRDHPQSYHHFMYQNFFQHIDIDPMNVHILDGNASDLVAECAKYEADIKLAGGIELFIGGIGADGHIAFNEPGSSLVSRTRVKTLAEDTLRANAASFFNNDMSQIPKQSLTVGVGTIMDAKEVGFIPFRFVSIYFSIFSLSHTHSHKLQVMILITGAQKSFALYKTIEEGVNHMWTASALQQHANALLICDDDATLELRVKTVKYFKVCVMNLH